jgi:hypothetical protein
MDDRIRQLVVDIYEAEEEVRILKNELKIEDMRTELKSLLSTQLSGETRKVVVEVDNIKAQCFTKEGNRKVKWDKLRELLHANTYNAVVTNGKSSIILEVGSK